jgi:hypothetical protein
MVKEQVPKMGVGVEAAKVGLAQFYKHPARRRQTASII